MWDEMSACEPVHSYGHGQGAVHGSDHHQITSIQQADVVHTFYPAEESVRSKFFLFNEMNQG